jgi:tetratricopeptide (TPR) repeat protein
MVRKLFLKYRLPLGILFLVLGGVITYTTGIAISWLFFLTGLILVFTHFFLGPLGLAQEYLEEADLEGADRILSKIRYPGLLYKPIRSTYYFLKSIVASTNQDLDQAETFMKKSVSLGAPMKEVQAQSYFQLGTISYQKSNLRAAEDYLKKALSAGLPDNESKAAAYLQLASIAVNRRDFKNVRRYHKLCKEQRPKTKEVVEQLKQLDKFIPRMPG